MRLDLPDRDSGLDTVVAEALAPGVRSLMDDASIRNLRGVPTVRFLEEHRTVLVQNDCPADDPAPPPELVEHYGVRAQMLAPIVREERLVGVVAVLQEALERAQRELDATV